LPGETAERPNIVLIMSDQHNAHVMGCAGNGVVQTPTLDALAADGVQFGAAYCPYPLCVPARMGFLTAQYPGDVDVWDNGNILASDVRTFAHSLTDAGCETVLCGRMHFLGPDQFHGFERRIYGDCYNFLSREIQGTGYNRTNGQTRYAVEVSGWGRMGYEEYDERVTEKAVEFIAGRRAADRPYCMVVGHVLPHNPLICSKELFEHYMERIPVPEPVSEEYLATLHPAIRAWRRRRGVDELTPEQHRRGRAAYYGLVTEMDRNIGRVIETIKTSPHAANTVIIYTTDHGDMAGEHGMWWKSSYYEGSSRVPIVVSWPGRLARGKTVDAVVNLIDLGPTVLELAGAEPLENVSGRSLVPFLMERPGPADRPNETFAEYLGAHGDKPSSMIRSGAWKLMYYSEFDSYLLFNLDEDPDEMTDRAQDPSCRQVAEALLAKVHARWSAERMLAGAGRARRTWQELGKTNECTTPHPVVHDTASADANRFDFSQVPGWDKIRERVTREGQR